MKQKESRILVIGSLNYDIILEQERLPEKGETYTVDRVTTGGGGKGANQAVQAAKMGIKTTMFGALGQDPFGDYLHRQLAAYGVDTTQIRRVSESTGLGINNVLPDGSLYANIVRGANHTLTTSDITNLEPEIARSAIVILQLEIPVDVTETAIMLAHKHGCYIILNAAPALPISANALAMVDCLIVNEKEASYYVEAPISQVEDALAYCPALHERIRDLVVITLGVNGSVLYDGKNKVLIPIREVQAVDTTGAGDSYVGAFAARIVTGTSYVEAAVYATLASSITVTRPGSQTSMPTALDIQALALEGIPKPVYY
jgi:ribokinase